MKNTVKAFGAVGATVLAIAACALPAAAFPKKLAYTFYPGSGGAYCDGITLISTDKLACHGFHVNADCNGSNDPAGGLVVKLGDRKVIEVITGDATQF